MELGGVVDVLDDAPVPAEVAEPNPGAGATLCWPAPGVTEVGAVALIPSDGYVIVLYGKLVVGGAA